MKKLITIQIIALFIVSICKGQDISAYQSYIKEVEKRVSNLPVENIGTNTKCINNKKSKKPEKAYKNRLKAKFSKDNLNKTKRAKSNNKAIIKQQ